MSIDQNLKIDKFVSVVFLYVVQMLRHVASICGMRSKVITVKGIEPGVCVPIPAVFDVAG